MANKKTDLPRQQPQSFWKRRSFKISAYLLLVFVLFFQILLPFASRWYLERWLVENGADTATVEKVRINPFRGFASLQGVDITKNGKTVFSNSKIYFNIGLKNLFNHEAYIEQATLADVSIDIEKQDDNTLRIGSYSIAPVQAISPDTASDVAEELEKDIPWLFRARIISLKNLTFHYRQPDLRIELVIDDALLERFSNDPDSKEGALTLNGSLNGAPVALNFPTFTIMPGQEIEGKVDISAVRLDDFQKVLAQYLTSLSGVAGINGSLSLTITPGTGDLDVHYDGSLQLENGAIAGAGWSLKTSMQYQGKGSYGMTQDTMKAVIDGRLDLENNGFTIQESYLDVQTADITISGKTAITLAEELVVDTDAAVQLAPTSVSMDGLETAVGRTTWDGAVHLATGTETKPMLVRTDGTLESVKHSYSIDLAAAPLDAAIDKLSWNGKAAYEQEPGSSGSSFVRTDGTLRSEAATLDMPGTMQLTQKNFSSEGTSLVTIGRDLGINYEGDLTIEQTGMELVKFSFDENLLHWSGKANLLLAENAQTISLAGALEGGQLATEIREAGLKARQESLSIVPSFTLRLGDAPSFSGKMSATGNGFELFQPDAPILSIAEISVPDIRDNGSGGALLDSLHLNNLKVPVSDYSPVGVTIAAVTLEKIASPDLASVGAARLKIVTPQVMDADQKIKLAEFDTISAETIQVSKDISISIDQVSSINAAFMKPDGADPQATLKKIIAEKIQYSAEHGFSCDVITLDSVFAAVVREKAAKPEGKETEPQRDKTEQPGKKRGQPGIPVKIRQISVSGTSSLKFTDKTLTQPFQTVFTLDSLRLDNIDLNTPEHPFSYKLRGNFDKYSPLTVTGSCAPLSDNLFIEQQAELKNYSMSSLSPYVVEAIGTYFTDGRLDISSMLKLEKNTIAMDNNIQLKDVITKTVNGELAQKLNNQLPVPLDLALTMLSDNDGTINIDVPIKGPLSSLNVGLADIIITALSKGITTAVTPYLAYTVLGPAGALAFAGAKIGQALITSDLPSLEFEPGEKELPENQITILDEVGSAIENNPELTYSICSKVIPGEITGIGNEHSHNLAGIQNEGIRKELFKLGEARSLAVRDYLVSRFNIDENRLLICNPGLNFEKEAKPRVEFEH